MFMLEILSKGDPFYESIKTVFTIHNLKYQGVFSSNSLRQTDLSPMYFSEDALKFYDAINFMKGAIVFSDKVTTVSKTYADEIKYSFFWRGFGWCYQTISLQNIWNYKWN